MILYGDSAEVLKSIRDNSVDLVATDPPYGITFMGRQWDVDLPDVEIWRQCYRVLKPGAFILAMAATRMSHRLAVNLEDAGFYCVDKIGWVFGSGFPKGTSLDKQLDARTIREWLDERDHGLDAKQVRKVISAAEKGIGIDGEADTLCEIWRYRNQIRYYSLPIKYSKELGFYVRQNHPTCKPVSLFRELIKLFKGTSDNPIILDPFAGSGTTGVAAELEDCAHVSIEAEIEYIPIIKCRHKHWAIPGVKRAYLQDDEIKEVNNELPLFEVK